MIRKLSQTLFSTAYSNLFGLLIIFIVLSIASRDFLTARNITNLTTQIAMVGILAIGMTPVILIKDIDLSVGRVAALCGVIAAMLQVYSGQNTAVAILAALAVGAAVGFWNGALISFFKIPAFIITLGMMSIADGLAYLLTKSNSVGPMNPGFAAIGNDYIPEVITVVIISLMVFVYLAVIIYQHVRRRQKGLPSNLNLDMYIRIGFVILVSAFFAYMFVSYHGMPYSVAILLGIALLAGVMLNKTTFGRHLYAIGGNEQAAHLAGINVRLDRIIVFVIMGALAAVAGIVLTARVGTATPAMGQMLELDAIAAVVIGGTSLNGGRGTIGGSIIGTFIIGILNNGMSLLDVDKYWQWVFKGLIIIGAVLLDRRNK